jgi:micrococcal nuclease
LGAAPFKVADDGEPKRGVGRETTMVARARASSLMTLAFAVTLGCGSDADRFQGSSADEAASVVTSSREPVPGERGISILVFPDAPGNDNRRNNGEYVTVFNSREVAADIEGWTLCEGAAHCFTFPSGASVPANGSIRLYSGAGVATDTSFYMGFTRAVWNNEHDTATLRDGDTVIAQDIY